MSAPPAIVLAAAAAPEDWDADGQALWARLAPYSQQHLLQWWPELSADEKAALKADVEKINLEQITRWFARTQGESGCNACQCYAAFENIIISLFIPSSGHFLPLSFWERLAASRCFVMPPSPSFHIAFPGFLYVSLTVRCWFRLLFFFERAPTRFSGVASACTAGAGTGRTCGRLNFSGRHARDVGVGESRTRANCKRKACSASDGWRSRHSAWQQEPKRYVPLGIACRGGARCLSCKRNVFFDCKNLR